MAESPRRRKKRGSDGLVNQLKEAIESSGLSVYKVAKGAGVKHAVVARFLSGERDLRLETASKIAEVLSLAFQKTEGTR
jgi:transcriptional regulator with XRE-family HTH domain